MTKRIQRSLYDHYYGIGNILSPRLEIPNIGLDQMGISLQQTNSNAITIHKLQKWNGQPNKFYVSNALSNDMKPSNHMT